MGEDHGVVGGQRLELVGRRGEGQAGDLGDLLRHHVGEADRRVEAGADRRAALGQLHQHRQALLDARDAVLDLLGIAGELLAQGQRRGVLGVGAADLDDARPAPGLVVEGVAQHLQGGDQAVDDFLGGGDVHGRRIGVVGRLAEIDVVVGVDGRLGAHRPAQHLDGAVGDHLVGVHVRLGARAGLPDRQREVLVELAVDHLLGGGDDGFAEPGIELAQGHVGFGGGPLDHAQGPDHRQGLLLPPDLEVAQAALRLRRPVAIGRNLDGSEAVGLGSGRGHELPQVAMLRFNVLAGPGKRRIGQPLHGSRAPHVARSTA